MGIALPPVKKGHVKMFLHYYGFEIRPLNRNQLQVRYKSYKQPPGVS